MDFVDLEGTFFCKLRNINNYVILDGIAVANAMLEPHHVVALGIFSTYFIVILALFLLILKNLWSLRVPLKPAKSWLILRVAVFIGLTIASFMHTWFCESFQVLYILGGVDQKN